MSLLKPPEDSVVSPHLTMQSIDDIVTSTPTYKVSKLQALIEVFRCELAKPGRSSALDDSFEPTKQWTPIYYAAYHKREAALLHFLRSKQTPDGVPNAQPLLCIAVAAGHIDVVKTLCKAGAKANARCRHSGETPLHLAVKAGRSDIMDILLRSQADRNARTWDTQETPLHYAAAKLGNTDMVLALLKHGASFEIMNNKGCTPAEISLQIKDFKTAIAIISAARGRPHKLMNEKQLLLKHIEQTRDHSTLGIELVAQILDVACPPESTTLVESIRTLDTALVKLILEKGADPNMPTAFGLYPLLAAFDAGSATVVQTLIDHGADVTLRNPHGLNVLQAALASPLSDDKESITKVIDMLLSRGATVHAPYPNGMTLLHAAVKSGLGLIDIAQNLLRHGVNINTQDDLGNTALHDAATSSRCVTMLLKHGADPHLKNNKNLTPLLHVIKFATGGDEPDLQRLIKASDLQQVDSKKRSALHLAAQNGLIKTVKFLLEARVDCTSTDAKKCTPLLLAVRHHQWAVVPLLSTQPGLNSWDENGLTALHHIAMSTPKAPSTWKQIAAAVAPFCEKGVSRSIRDQTGSTPLIQAIKCLPEEGLPVIEALLYQKGSQRSNCIAHEDHQQHNALYYAATLDKPAFVETLLRHGMPITLSEWRSKKVKNATNKVILKLIAEHEWLRRIAVLRRRSASQSEEPLLPDTLPVSDLKDMFSMGLDPNNLPNTKPAALVLWTLLEHSKPTSIHSSQYFHDILKVAFESGADPNAVSTRKSHGSSRKRNSPQPMSTAQPLSYVIEQFSGIDLDVVKLFLEAGATLSVPSSVYEGRFPLHSAVRVNRIDVVEELIRRKVNADGMDNRKRNALFVAVENGAVEMVKLLLQYKINVNAQDNDGNTPLHTASAAGSFQLVSSLLHHGANLDSKNNTGLTPSMCVSDKLSDQEKEKMARMLQPPKNIVRQQPSAVLEPPKTRSLETSRVKKPVEKQILTKSQPLIREPCIKERQTSVLQPTSCTPATVQVADMQASKIEQTEPIIRTSDAPAPFHVSKQLLSIRVNVASTSAPSPPPASTKPTPTQIRVDSGLSLSGSEIDHDKPLPIPDEKKRASLVPLQESDELASWLNVSKMLERL